jgi:hypothetical protein
MRTYANSKENKLKESNIIMRFYWIIITPDAHYRNYYITL